MESKLRQDDDALWRRFAESRDPAIREELVRRNMPFAKRLALRYRGASESFDDLLQVANLGLLGAIDRFDPERGIPFTAFASPTILGELKRHFRDRVWTVRVPRGLHDRMAEVDKAITELTKQLQRSPAVGEIAERLGVEQTDVLEVMEANHNRRPLSLDRPAGSEESGRRLWLASITSSTSVCSTPSRSAISPTEGERCSCLVSSVIALSTSAMRSCSPRGTRTVQTRSIA